MIVLKRQRSTEQQSMLVVKDIRGSFDFPAPLCDLTGALDTTTNGIAADDASPQVQKPKKNTCIYLCRNPLSR